MKKILYILILMLLSFGVSACNNEDNNPTDTKAVDIEVEILSEISTFDQIIIHVLVSYDFDNVNDLFDVVQMVAGDTYLDFFDQIDGKRFTMTLYIYQSQSDFDDLDATYGFHTFDINRVNKPGLSPNTNSLKIA